MDDAVESSQKGALDLLERESDWQQSNGALQTQHLEALSEVQRLTDATTELEKKLAHSERHSQQQEEQWHHREGGLQVSKTLANATKI